MPKPAKYSHINFSPPEAVQAAAKRGLEMRKKYGRGGLSNKEASAQGIGSGVQRATNLANGDTVSPDTIGRMVSFFARHEKNKDSRMDNGEPGAGMIAWALWGGDAGRRWAEKVKRQMDAADQKQKGLIELAQVITKSRSAPLIEKIGARHTRAEAEMIQKMHNLALDLGATCKAMTRKAGARHSQSDQRMIQRIHDDCAGLGAKCKAELQQGGPVYALLQVLKDQADAPNYKPASSPQRCKNCVYFLGDPGRDWCDLYDFVADPDYVCDSWAAQVPDEIPGYVANKARLATLTERVLVLRGGRGSGNWAHTGRAGKRGGSGRGGGLRRIGVKPGSSHKERKEASRKVAGRQKKAKPPPKKQSSSKKPAAKSKLDNIFDDAPKSSEDAFTKHLVGKMMNGEITLKDGRQLTQRFKAGQEKKQSSPPKTGDIKSAKKFTESELKRGDSAKQWRSWNGKLTGQEKAALYAYSSEPFDDLPTDYIKINSHLRGKDKNPSKATRDAIKQTDKALAKGRVSQDTTVYRGFPASVLGGDPSKLVGKTITDKGYTSTSLSERVASTFNPNIISEIRIPKGARGGLMDAVLSKDQLSALGRDPEHELLLPRNSKFRIISTEKVGSKTKVFMELVQ